MLGLKFLPYVCKQIVRHPARSFLTISGVAVAMFLFSAIYAMQEGARRATEVTAEDAMLVVYRENRFCPATSRMPEYYSTRIKAVPGVAEVIPMRIIVNNCRASLDVVVFRGVPPDAFESYARGQFEVIQGSVEDWSRRQDAALIGEKMAARRGLKVGDAFEAVGLRVSVAGIVRSGNAQDENVAYVHLLFLQKAAQSQEGIVTQFNVRVKDPAQLEAVAQAIDAEFKNDPDPTLTRPEKAFVADAASDVLNLIGFTRWVALGCVLAVLGLVANAIVLSVQARVKEHAILQALGFRSGRIAALIVTEGVLVSLTGGLLGAAAATLFLYWGQFSLSNEGLSIHFEVSWGIWASGLGLSVLMGVLACLVPAWQASRQSIAATFRAA